MFSVTRSFCRLLQKRQSSHRQYFLSKIVITLVTLLSFTNSQAQEIAKPKKPPVTVIAYQVKAEPVTQTLNLIGTLKAVQSVDIRASVTETVIDLPFTDGQAVQKGDLIAKLNSQEEQAELKQSRIISAEANRQYLRAKKLVGRGSITEATLDELKAEWRSALAEQAIIQARINDRTIKAPFSGQLGFKAVHEGALVTNNTLITTLDNTEKMFLDVQIPDPYLSQLQLGQTLSFDSAGQQFSGQLQVINPRINSESRLLQVRALVDNGQQKLKSGMQVQAKLNLGVEKKLLLPETAVLMQGEKNFVYVVQVPENNSKTYSIRKQAIEVGKRYFGQIHVVKGIKAGEVVVSQGILRLQPKSKITIKTYQDKQPLDEMLRGKPLNIPTKAQVN